ncbi:hypothetical protein RhiLY_02356 [Ceratobasidium sp. AG-Ba]|nr:hypothetical protein RhiLY_02356 [Ceratobasidium sp. AG-Ba]
MAPTRTNKSAKATSVRYDPETPESRSTTPQVIWGKQRDAIRRCDSFIRSSDFANPSTRPSPDYIPMGERWNCRWLADHTLQCPNGQPILGRKGPRPDSDKAMQATKLFVIEEWMGNEVEHLVREVQSQENELHPNGATYSGSERTPARLRQGMQATKLFVIEEWMGNEVEHLVREVQKVKKMTEWESQGKREAVPKWVENSTEWWFRLSDIEEMKVEWMRSLGDKGQKMAIVAKVVEEWCQAPDISKLSRSPKGNILWGSSRASGEGKVVKRELLDWLDQRAWDKGNEDLSSTWPTSYSNL